MGAELAKAGVDVNKTRDAFGQLQQLNAKYGELAFDGTLAAGGALPPPFGTAVDLFSLGRSIWKWDGAGALADLAGFIPLGGDAVKGGRVLNKLNDFRKALDVAKSSVAKSLNKTKEVAAKYWDDIAKKNRKAYEDAAKKCNSKECRDKLAHLKGPQYNNVPADGDAGKWVGERGDSVWQPTNGGPAVKYQNGFPDYGPHVYSKNGVAGNVDIPMKGNHSTDFTAADKAMRDQLGDPNWRRPSDHTWHHNENGATMQLIPKSGHATGGGASTPHMGGASMYSGGNATEF